MNTKLFSLFLFIIINLQLFSQEYDPIIKEDAFWDIKTIIPNGGCQYFESLKRIQIDGDTIINSKTYKKLKSALLKDINNLTECISEPFYIDVNDFTSIDDTYLREDTTEKKLYILTNSLSTDHLEEYTVCDFSLNIGDPLLNYFGYDNTQHELLITDITTNSENKKVFYTNDGSYYTEGIGRNEGNLNIYFNLVDGTYERIHCYGNAQNQSNCATVLSTNKYELSSLKIFPNPAKNILTIQNTEDITLKIYSITGSLLKTIKSKTNLEIDISSFKSGIYVLKISNLTGKKTSKILKL